jgi:hypothetical protein
MSNGLNDFLNLAQSLDLNAIKEDLFNMNGLTDEQKKEVEAQLSEKGFNKSVSDVKKMQEELKKAFK